MYFKVHNIRRGREGRNGEENSKKFHELDFLKKRNDDDRVDRGTNREI